MKSSVRKNSAKTKGGRTNDRLDVLMAERRRNEPRESLETVRRRLIKAGLLGS
jgi:septum formation topological specificity factor MinE